MTVTQDPNSLPVRDDLNGAEWELFKAAASGKVVDLQAGDTDLDNPANAADWGDDRNVRADFLADLLTGDQPTSTGRLKSVRLRGARITGTLDLEACKLLCPVLIQECHFAEPINLDEAKAMSMSLPGCHVPGLTAEQFQTTGTVEFNDRFTAHGKISLLGAHIGGQFNLRGACLVNETGAALSADSLTVDRSMFCSDGFAAQGGVRLLGAHIGGALSFRSASLTNPSGPALHAEGLTVDRNMFCDNEFAAHGGARLRGARIGGNLYFDDAHLTDGDGFALDGTNLSVDGNMYCRRKFKATSQIRLYAARIAGDLNFTGATLRNGGNITLDATNIAVGHDLFCRDDFAAYGEISLHGAVIDGQIVFSGARLTNRSRKDRVALNAVNLTVNDEMICDQGFTATGEIKLKGANVKGILTFTSASLTNPEGFALNLETAQCGTLEMPEEKPVGNVNLALARTRVLKDPKSGWPDSIQLQGFSYEILDNDGIGTRDRLRWLRLLSVFTPQVYDQLAASYRNAGDPDTARIVLVEKEWRRRKSWNPLRYLWHFTVGYGYRTWQAFIWAAALTVVGSLVFSGAYPAHMVAVTSHPPQFQSAIYTLDVLLPIGGLGEKSAWQATGGYLYWHWGLAIAGWVLSAAVVAGLTGILKRD